MWGVWRVRLLPHPPTPPTPPHPLDFSLVRNPGTRVLDNTYLISFLYLFRYESENYVGTIYKLCLQIILGNAQLISGDV